MTNRFRSAAAVLLVGVCCVAAVHCGSPTKPTVSIATAQPASPARNAAVSYYSQPVMVTVANAATSVPEPSTSVVEVATDPAFGSIAITKELVPGADGQSTVTLDHLSAATTYYWRVKTTAGSNPPVVSPASSFTVGPLLQIQAPSPVQPLADSFPHKRPTFTVKNAERTDATVALTYEFEVASDASFGSVIGKGTVPEGSGETSFTLGSDLVPGTAYFWRARASYAAAGIKGSYSPAQAFTTVFPDDGKLSYTLVLRSPSSCVAHAVNSGFCSGSPLGWVKSDFSFDGTLIVDGDTLRYELPPNPTGPVGSPPFTIEFRRTGKRLAGNVSGTTPDTSPIVVTSVTMRGTLAGQADNRGGFDGAFDGELSLWHFGMPCEKTASCATSGFSWTLMPR